MKTNEEKYQEIFTKAYLGLASQGFEKSLKSNMNDICMYKGLAGRRCAIGHVIPDDMYCEELEGLGATAPSVLKVVWPDANSDERLFLEELQRSHDYSGPNTNMEILLQAFAEKYNLQIPATL